MTPEEVALMKETGVAPCGCKTEWFGPDSHTTYHDDNCQIVRPDDPPKRRSRQSSEAEPVEA